MKLFKNLVISAIWNPTLVLITEQISNCSPVNSCKVFSKNFTKIIK